MMNHLVEDKTVIAVSGSGKTHHDAVESCFKAMRIQLQSVISYPIVSVSADAIEITRVEKEVKPEAFLFFFFKRLETLFTLECTMHLTVKYLKIGDE